MRRDDALGNDPEDLEVEILAVDWRRLVGEAPDGGGHGDAGIASRAFREGLRIAGEGRPPPRPDPDTPLHRQIGLLERMVAWQGADVAVHRFTYATNRERFDAAAEREQLVYERKIALDADVVPALKEEAKRLRAEVRELEARLVAMGGDPGAVEPTIDWRWTLAVETSGGARFETIEDRRTAAVDVFRRLRDG
jgi:hypothetical protein